MPQDSLHGQTPPGQSYQSPDHPAPPPFPAPVSGQYPPPTNTMALLALIFAFTCWPLAIVFGHLARKQIRTTGESGHRMATAGLVIGYLILGLVGLAIIAVAILAGTAMPD